MHKKKQQEHFSCPYCFHDCNNITGKNVLKGTKRGQSVDNTWTEREHNGKTKKKGTVWVP